MNQLHDAEAGSIVPEQGKISAIGGEPLPPPPSTVSASVRQDPTKVNTVNEYNSFNLVNVTPPIAPKWKTSETLLDDICKYRWSCQRIIDGPMCHITSGEVKISTSCLIRSMTLTMCSGGLRNFVSQYATFAWSE